MKCPACKLVCSDKKDLCPQCQFDLRPQKKTLGLPIANPKATLEELKQTNSNKPQTKPATAQSTPVNPSAAKAKTTNQEPSKPQAITSSASSLHKAGINKPSAAPQKAGFFSKLFGKKTNVSLEEKPAGGLSPATMVSTEKPNETPQPASSPEPESAASSIEVLPLSDEKISVSFLNPSLAKEQTKDSHDSLIPLLSLETKLIDETANLLQEIVPEEEEQEEAFPAEDFLSVEVLEPLDLDSFSPDSSLSSAKMNSSGSSLHPSVAPQVIEFGDDDTLLEQQLDQMLGDESIDIEAVIVKRPTSASSASPQITPDDEEGFSFEIELDDEKEDFTEKTMLDTEGPALVRQLLPNATTQTSPSPELPANHLSIEASETATTQIPAASKFPTQNGVRNAAAQKVLERLTSQTSDEELWALVSEAYGLNKDISPKALRAEGKAEEDAIAEGKEEEIGKEDFALAPADPAAPETNLESLFDDRLFDESMLTSAENYQDSAHPDNMESLFGDFKEELENPDDVLVANDLMALDFESNPADLITNLTKENVHRISSTSFLSPSPSEKELVQEQEEVAEFEISLDESLIDQDILENSLKNEVAADQGDQLDESVFLTESDIYHAVPLLADALKKKPEITENEEQTPQLTPISDSTERLRPLDSWHCLEVELEQYEANHDSQGVEIELSELSTWEPSERLDLYFELVEKDLSELAATNGHAAEAQIAVSETSTLPEQKIDSSELDRALRTYTIESKIHQAKRELRKELGTPLKVGPHTGSKTKGQRSEENTTPWILASRFRRLVASLIDLLFSGTAGIAVSAVWFLPPHLRQTVISLRPVEPWEVFPFAAQIVAVGIIIWLVQQTLLTAGRGQTIGKRIMRITVTDWNGNLLDFDTSFLRACALITTYLSFGLGFLPGVTKTRRFLHDRLAHTQVIAEPKNSPSKH